MDFLPLADLDVTKALALGDKLTGVLLYHAAPGALDPAQLAQRERGGRGGAAGRAAGRFKAARQPARCGRGQNTWGRAPAASVANTCSRLLPRVTIAACAETKLTTGLAIKAQDPAYSLAVGSANGNVSGVRLGVRLAGIHWARALRAARLALCTQHPLFVRPTSLLLRADHREGRAPALCLLPCIRLSPFRSSCPARAQTTVSGVYPGNTAQILDSFAVCGSRVYVVDKARAGLAAMRTAATRAGNAWGLREAGCRRTAAAAAAAWRGLVAARLPPRWPACHPCIPSQVLVPAASLDAIPAVQGGLDFSSTDAAAAAAAAAPKPAAAAPAPAPEAAAATAAAPTPAAPAPEGAPASPTGGASASSGASRVSGVALASGYLANCTVQLLDRAGTPLKVTSTDGEGRFSFDCGADCASLQVRPAAALPAPRFAVGPCWELAVRLLVVLACICFLSSSLHPSA